MKENKTIEQVAEGDVSIEEKVSFLKEPAAYPYQGIKVEVKETHMSWVFLVDDVVYKLKKPVLNRLIDFRTLEARLKNCREEIRLNKRLANDIYLGIVPLVINKAGKLQIEGKGKIIEWLVKMKRIPEENMLDYAIKHRTIKMPLLKNAAKLLTEFYKNSLSYHMEPDFYRKKLNDEIISTQAQLQQPLFYFPLSLIGQISNTLIQFLGKHYLLFDERVSNGKIIEAHGDLRPEHICLLPQPAIIDVLEFNFELRIMDVAEELSFLDMECEMMENSQVGQLFIDIYRKLAKDNIPPSLITFYKIKKACLRAYLVARHIQEFRYKNDTGWLAKANAYLQLAGRYHEQLAT